MKPTGASNGCGGLSDGLSCTKAGGSGFGGGGVGGRSSTVDG
jgi:hypothetical protein